MKHEYKSNTHSRLEYKIKGLLSLGVMMLEMFRLRGEEDKIVDRVISAVPVNVMNDFTRQELPVDSGFHDSSCSALTVFVWHICRPSYFKLMSKVAVLRAIVKAAVEKFKAFSCSGIGTGARLERTDNVKAFTGGRVDAKFFDFVIDGSSCNAKHGADFFISKMILKIKLFKFPFADMCMGMRLALTEYFHCFTSFGRYKYINRRYGLCQV